MTSAVPSDAGGEGVSSAPSSAEDEKLAAEWVEQTTTQASSLNQSEIDAMLGVGQVDTGPKDRRGVLAIVNSDRVCYERLPLLEVIFDRLVRLLTTSLRNLTSDTVEVTLAGISSSRFGDYLNSIPFPALLAIFHCSGLDGQGLATIDSNLIYSIVDVLLGGRRGASLRIEGRPYTNIERNLVANMLEAVLRDMGSAFEPVCKAKFELNRLETNPRFAAIARPNNAVVLIKLRVDMEERGGHIEFVLPYAMLEPIRDVLLQSYMGEKFGRDAFWEAHLATTLWKTKVELEVVLDDFKLPLSRVQDFEVGQTLILNVGPESEFHVRSGGVNLTTGKIGRVGRNVAVSLTSAVKSQGS